MAQGTTDSKVGVTKNITTAITEATEDIMVSITAMDINRVRIIPDQEVAAIRTDEEDQTAVDLSEDYGADIYE